MTPTLQKILEGVAITLRNLEIPVQGVDLAGSPLAKGELVDAVGEVVCVIVDHDGQVGVAAGKGDRATRRHVKIAGDFPHFDGPVVPWENKT